MKSFVLVVLSLCLVSSQLRWEECKRDCTLDWTECLHGCTSIGNPQYCHTNCQKVVYICLDDCPMNVCVDKCSRALEECRYHELYQTPCENIYNKCEQLCIETFRKEL